MRNLFLLLVLIIYTFSLNSWARKPAVLPQMEVANDFPARPVNQSKGYTFEQNVNRSIASTPQQGAESGATTFLAIFLLGVPLMLWGAIAWKSRKLQHYDNVVSLHADPNTEEESNHNQQWPKAS